MYDVYSHLGSISLSFQFTWNLTLICKLKYIYAISTLLASSEVFQEVFSLNH